MIFNKYDASKDGSVVGAHTSSSSSSSTEGTRGKASLERVIWGQDDDGGDVDGDLTCQGNMYIVDNYVDDEDDDDDEEGYAMASPRVEVPVPMAIADDLASKFDNNEGGNHYVKRQLVVDGRGDFKAVQYQSGYNLPDDDDSRKLASTEWVNKKIDSHKKLTINDSKGNNLGEFDNSADKTITIKNYDDEILDLQDVINNGLDDLNGSVGRLQRAKSVVLVTAELLRSGTGIAFNSYVTCYDGLSLNTTRVGEGYIDLVFNVDTTKIANLKNLYANASIGLTQSNSDTDDEILNGTGSGKACDGAYGGMWTHTRPVLSADKKTLVVRARIWHKDKDDNESVDSNKDWSVAAISKISFIVAGEPSIVV